jgi:crossover junction endodeoxyribonuclease RuvC
VRILGIDPGSRVTGYGIVDVRGAAEPVHVANGCIRLAHGELADRLRDIFTALTALVDRYAPDEVAIERIFVARNADSALKLGHARGAALCAVLQGQPLPVFEYSPREIKLAVAGRGGAEKTQVQSMVHLLLRPEGQLQADAADALATALCRAYVRRTQAKLDRSPGAAAGPAADRSGAVSPGAELLAQAHAWRSRRRRR